MDFFKLLFDHFWEVIIFLFLFGGSIWAALRWLVHRSLEHREQMQEKRNEELRLRIQLEQIHNERPSTDKSSKPLPKEVSWEEQPQTGYEQGYQQQQMYQQ